MIANQIKKIKSNKKNYILTINNNNYTIDYYFYECLLPYEGKVLEVSQMLEVIAFSSANEHITKLYKKIFENSLSTYEVKQKLISKEVSEEHIKIIINRLKSEGHLDDKKFIEHYKEIYQQKKGKKAFKSFLINKHISSILIDKTMLEYDENEEYALEYAQRYINSKTSSNAMLKTLVKAHLINKGFSESVINNVLSKLEFNDEIINLRKEVIKYLKKYHDDEYKVISKLANKGYNVSAIKKVIQEEGNKNED